MSKRANGEGSFYFDEKRQTYRAMITTPAGKRLTKSSKDEAVIKDWLNEQRLLVGRGQHVEPSAILLKDWVYTWIETYSKPQVRQRTYERYLSLSQHTESIGNMPIQKLTPHHLQAFYNGLQEAGHSSDLCKKVHVLLHSALKRAVINRYIQNNPTDFVDTPKVVREEMKVFTPDEVDLLLSIAKGYKYFAAILLAFTSGVRLGELLGIRWQDINMEDGIIYVRQNLQASTEKGLIFEPPKTASGKRKISIPAETVAALREYKKYWAEIKLKHPGSGDLVFVTSNLTPISPQNFLKQNWYKLQMDAEFALNNFTPNPQKEKEKLKDILEKCRLKWDWKRFDAKNFHSIRHTYATTLLANGIPTADVSKALGHAKISTTHDVYSHALPENSRLIADKIAGVLLKNKKPESLKSKETGI